MVNNNVYIAFQNNEDARPLIEAIEQDNSEARIEYYPAMVKIDAPG
ncbi:MAG: MmoB/DmpM family protein, partial [Acidihalobacter sp.]